MHGQACFRAAGNCTPPVGAAARNLEAEPHLESDVLSSERRQFGHVLIIWRVGYVISIFWNQYINRLNFPTAWTCKGDFVRQGIFVIWSGRTKYHLHGQARMRRPSPTIADHGPNSLKMCICVTNIHIELTPLNGLVPVTAWPAAQRKCRRSNT